MLEQRMPVPMGLSALVRVSVKSLVPLAITVQQARGPLQRIALGPRNLVCKMTSVLGYLRRPLPSTCHAAKDQH